MMKVGFHIKFLQERPTDEAQEITTARVKSESIRLLNKGLRPIHWKAIVGYDGDDLIKNYYTVAFTTNVIKIPRFVRNHLLRKVYKVRRIKH